MVIREDTSMYVQVKEQCGRGKEGERGRGRGVVSVSLYLAGPAAAWETAAELWLVGLLWGMRPSGPISVQASNGLHRFLHQGQPVPRA